jgi:hypothetical protein
LDKQELHEAMCRKREDDDKTTEERKIYFTREGKDVGFIEQVVRMSNVYLHGTQYGGKKGFVLWWNIYEKYIQNFS